MPKEMRISWIGDDGATRTGVVVLTDDLRAWMKRDKVARRIGDPMTPEQRAERVMTKRQRMASYAAAEASLWAQGPVSDAVFADRTGPNGCGGCEHRRKSTKDPIGYCGECGCGPALRAMLTVKGRMPKAACPLTPPRWTDAPGEGVTAFERIKQAAGVAGNLIDMLAGAKRRREGKESTNG